MTRPTVTGTRLRNWEKRKAEFDAWYNRTYGAEMPSEANKLRAQDKVSKAWDNLKLAIQELQTMQSRLDRYDAALSAWMQSKARNPK